MRPDARPRCVERCDPDSAAWRATLAHALVALFGDLTCSPRGRPQLASDLMRNNTCYAALDADGLFLGLAAVSAGNVIFTFCVADRARGMGGARGAGPDRARARPRAARADGRGADAPDRAATSWRAGTTGWWLTRYGLPDASGTGGTRA